MNKKQSLWCIILFSFLGISVAMAQKSEKDRHWVWGGTLQQLHLRLKRINGYA